MPITSATRTPTPPMPHNHHRRALWLAGAGGTGAGGAGWLVGSAPRAVTAASVVATASRPSSALVVRGIDIFVLLFARLWLQMAEARAAQLVPFAFAWNVPYGPAAASHRRAPCRTERPPAPRRAGGARDRLRVEELARAIESLTWTLRQNLARPLPPVRRKLRAEHKGMMRAR